MELFGHQTREQDAVELMREFIGKLHVLTMLAVLGAPPALLPFSAHAQTVTREQVATALPKLEALADAAARTKKVPGLAIAVVHNDEVVYLKGFGVREVDKPDVVDADTVFQLASVSKPISSAVVSALVSDGHVKWDSRVADLDPSFRLTDPYPTSQLTLRDLFAHRSGLPGTAGDDLEDIGYDRSEILGRLRFVPPSSSFRAGYSYSNFGLTEGAAAAAAATGKPWEEVAEDKLYRPLGMASTSSRYTDFISRSNRAALHVQLDGAWTAKVQRNPDAQAPAGGVSSNVRDLAQWMRLELADGVYDRKRLIETAALDQAHRAQMPLGAHPVASGPVFYGLGWNVEFGRHGTRWGHAGAFSAGAQTVVALYPKARLGIVVLTNAFPTGVPDGLADSFADLAFDGKVDKDWIAAWGDLYHRAFVAPVEQAEAAYANPPASAAPALAPEAYTGGYANDFFGDAVVANDSGQLTLKVGPQGSRAYPMRHFDRDVFLIFPDRETPDRPYPVRFSIGPEGRASSVTIDSLNANGLGTLSRKTD
jgi:CubicO group peptidase (beta-lactamase class C family)